MLLALYTNWWEDWALYHKVVFDGENKLIIINSAESIINVKDDVYSSWKEWAQLRDNGKFLPAIRTTGGDPASGGEKTGDVYFCTNGWRILINNNCTIAGVIYSDNYDTPFLTSEDTKFVINKVSSLVQSLGFNGTVEADLSGASSAVWNYLMSDMDTPGSVGERIGKLLTVAKFLGLK